MIYASAKTQISMGIHPVCSESSHALNEDPMFLHVDSEDSDQTGQRPRLIWVLAGHKDHFVGFVMRRLNSLLSVLQNCSNLKQQNSKYLDQPGQWTTEGKFVIPTAM